MSVITGLEQLKAERFARLRGRRVGLVTHPPAVDRQYRSAAELFFAHPDVNLVSLFGPEHGFTGSAQDLEGVGIETSPFPGVSCHSLYGHDVASLRPKPDQLADVDVLVIDLVDIGSRYYTFAATMLYCLEEAARAGKPVLVLDRPNPLGGIAVEGPILKPGFESFVGPHAICTRHGRTIGELAHLFKTERGINVELDVLDCQGWARDQDHDATGLPWVMPSPNMPTLDTAYVYPGMCLIEGTNLSEGRGTTRPFELCGFPSIDSYRVARELNECARPGIVFRPVTFKPTFQKHAGQLCGGVQLHVTNRAAFQPVRIGLAVLWALRRAAGDRFKWRTEEYEFVTNPIAIDLLFGSDRERSMIEAGAHWCEIAALWVEDEMKQLKVQRNINCY